MLSPEQLAALREAIAGDADLRGLLARLDQRTRRLVDEGGEVPRVKALLSRDGGVCPVDGRALAFDPWSPAEHRCPVCGQVCRGERHHRHWARARHLWLAERAADLSLLAAVADREDAGGRAVELLEAYGATYLDLPNRDNVLGPGRLFFSTYLESLWLTSYLAAAHVLQTAGLLPEAAVEGVNTVADEAAHLIGEFNEGLSNRQTWHAAALTAVAVWFGDEELAQSAIESRTGLLGHLADGFGEDGLWHEGENYHLFALRGLMQGMQWARLLGVDLLDDPELRRHFRAALLGPVRTALPDLTYPARGDARYGVSLAQPAMLELWEIGRHWLGGDPALDAWLAELYRAPAPPADHYDAWLHDAGRAPPVSRTRADLSWWALTALGPATAAAAPHLPESCLLPDQGLAVLRTGDLYASLECGPDRGGHGHPDSLHLTLHAGGVHWLPDPGTGSYVQGTLAWYRSAAAHNAPLLDGLNVGGEPARCEAFDVKDGWAWARAVAGPVRRTVVAGPEHVVDLVELEARQPTRLELPWHPHGEWRVVSPGRWEQTDGEADEPRFLPADPAEAVHLEVEGPAGARLGLWLLAPDAELRRRAGPALPTEEGTRPWLLLRATTTAARWAAVLDPRPGEPHGIRGVRLDRDRLTVETPTGPVHYATTAGGLGVEHGATVLALGGLRARPLVPAGVMGERPAWDTVAHAPRAWQVPALDGSLDGFDTGQPIELADELHYLRSEEPYEPDQFSARCWVNHDVDALYLAVEVTKPDVVLHPADAPPLALDNDPDDIHTDGVQVGYAVGDDPPASLLATPAEDGTVRVRRVGEPAWSTGAGDGAWAMTDEGYRMTLRIPCSTLAHLPVGSQIRFDVAVNEAHPDRERRAGQLRWSGGGGWVYLRGDVLDPRRFGVLHLD